MSEKKVAYLLRFPSKEVSASGQDYLTSPKKAGSLLNPAMDGIASKEKKRSTVSRILIAKTSGYPY